MKHSITTNILFFQVASKMVAMKTHELKNGSKIEITFPLEENNHSDSESEEEEKAPDQSQGGLVCLGKF